MHSPEASDERKTALQPLLAVARAAIACGLRAGVPLGIDLTRFDSILRAEGASFVTRHTADALRGCMGSLAALRPLVTDVSENAFQAALRDPRFPTLRPEELPGLRVHVSVLGAQVPLEAGSEKALLARLRPGVDGLVLEEGPHRATFLPVVWAQLPTPRAFLEQLKRKAGLPGTYWSETIRLARYDVETLAE